MEEEEVRLRDYVSILMKHKLIVILVPLISIITTGIYVFKVQKPAPVSRVYEAATTVRNGRIVNPVLEKQEGLFIASSIALQKGYKATVKDFPGTLFFEISIQDKDEESAKSAVEGIAREYVAMGNALYDRAESVIKKEQWMLQQSKALSEQQLADAETLLSELPSFENYAEVVAKNDRLTGLEKQDKNNSYLRMLNDHTKAIIDIKRAILSIDKKIFAKDAELTTGQRFEIIGSVQSADISPEAKKTTKKDKLLVSAVLGLIGGILLALAAENWIA